MTNAMGRCVGYRRRTDQSDRMDTSDQIVLGH